MAKTLALLIALAVVLAATARPIARLLNAVTPLVLVMGVLLLAWHLVRYYTRQ